MALLPAGKLLVLQGYTVDPAANGIQLHFVCSDPGPGLPTDYYLFMPHDELEGATNLTQLRTLINGRIDRYIGTDAVIDRVNQITGETFTV